MSADVAVVDYGIGNLYSVRRAFEHCGFSVLVSGDPEALAAAPRLVLPGVGAFADGMRRLQSSGLDQMLREYAASGRPLLGICLGMQMLATTSEEFGEHAGLAIVPGRVLPIPARTATGEPHKIPWVGWTTLEKPPHLADWQDTILEGLPARPAVYVVHSYMMQPDDEAHRLADCSYNGHRVSAAVRRDNVQGTQFHPEKSGEIGLAIARRFGTLD
jgi:imidazole glycerol-phosphate synthase subunit HisH